MTISAQQLAITSDLEGTGTGSRNLQIATALSKTFSGASITIPAGELSITGTPSGANDAVNKSYVDGLSAGLDPKESCRAATTAALVDSPTYDNGTGGVGATLTGAGNNSINPQDGITLVVSDRLLVKDQAAALQNGIYEVTTVGQDPVSATKTITTSVSVGNGQTLTIDDGTNTPIAFTTDNVNAGPPTSASATARTITFTENPGPFTANQIALDIVAALNGTNGDLGPALGTRNYTASAVGNVVTLTKNTPGSAENNGGFSGAVTGWSFTGGAFAGGTDGVAYVLTRTTDFDGSPSNEVSGGAFTFVEQGTANQGDGYNVVADGDVTIGTDAVNWSQFSSTGALSAGDGIDITAQVVSAVVADFAGAGLEDDGSNNLRIAAAAAGDGLTGGGGSALAVQPSAGGSLQVDGTGVDVADGGIDTAELADNGVTSGKLAFQWAIATAAASAFSFDGTRSNVTLANAALADTELASGTVAYRNGVDELNKTLTTSSADDWSVSGTTWSIHNDITASGDTYRLRYKIANT